MVKVQIKTQIVEKIIYEKICIVCGEDFTAQRYTAKTCSQKCRNTLYISRKIAGNTNLITDDIPPVSTPVSTPVTTPVTTPVSTPVSTPVTTPMVQQVSVAPVHCKICEQCSHYEVGGKCKQGDFDCVYMGLIDGVAGEYLTKRQMKQIENLLRSNGYGEGDYYLLYHRNDSKLNLFMCDEKDVQEARTKYNN